MEFLHLKNILINQDECCLFYMDARGYQILELIKDFPNTQVILVEDSKFLDITQYLTDYSKQMHAVYIISSDNDAILLKLKYNI